MTGVSMPVVARDARDHRGGRWRDLLHKVNGRDGETGQSVSVELGHDAATGYFFGVDAGERELAFGVEIGSLPELVARTRQYIVWTRQLYQALRDAPVSDFAEMYPNDPVTKILLAVR